MTTLNIGGKKVTVSDDFLQLSPEQQNATVDEIASTMGNPKVDPATNQPPGVPAFIPPGVEGYNQQTGEVAPPQNTMMDKAGAFSTGGLQGVPIVGPYLDKASSAVAAAMSMPLTGKSFGELYDQGNRYSEDVRRENPHTATAGGVVGATAALVPAIAAAPAAFGAGEGGLGVRSAISALTGGGIGGADAAVRSSGDPYETLRGIASGFGLGAIAPGAGAIIGKGIGAVADWAGRPALAELRGFSRDALARITKAMEADSLSPQVIQQRLAQLGPDATLADLGPNLQQTAAGLVAKPGQARGIVQSAMRDRDAGASARIAQALDNNIGPAPVPSQIDAGLAASQNDVAQGYGPLFQNARAVNTQGIADDLDSATANLRGPAQAAVQRVRRFLDIPGTTELDPHPQALFQTRQAIDGLLATEDNPQVIRQLTTVRQRVDGALADAVPGIKDVDAQFAELARQRSAVGQGQTVLDSGRTAPRPQELARQMQEGALPQGTQVGPSAVPLRLRQGARAEIDRIVGTNSNDRVALQRIVKGEGDWNPQKLATLFGPDRARRIIDILDAERTFADTNNFVTRNSATAARTEAVKDLDGGAGPGLGIVDSYKAGGVLGLGRAGALKAGAAVVDALRGRGHAAAQSALARGLVSGDHDAIVQALSALSPVPMPAKTISKVAEALLLGTGMSGSRP